MNILPQKQLFELLNLYFGQFSGVLNQLAFPYETIASSFNYSQLVESLFKASKSMCIDALRYAIEKIDNEWCNRPDRTSTHHIKVTRSRTIITLFGELTYTRRIYVNKHTKEFYTYVDEFLGLHKGDRFDPCVKARIIEAYASSNSMIKVGQNVGREIYAPFSTNTSYKDYAIPRQTIQKIITNTGKVSVPFNKKDKTPKHLYIMADEKRVPLQTHNEYGNAERSFTKEVVIFEDIENAYRSSKKGLKQRHRLIGKIRIIGHESNIWLRVEEALNQLYEMDKVCEIHIMGDGAEWIKNGVKELNTFLIDNKNLKLDFTLDAFHYNQSIIRITRDKNDQILLYESMQDNDKKAFETICKSLINSENCTNPERIEKEMSYIINQWPYIMRRISGKMSMPCAMEGSISHDLCNPFASVPKAYIKENLDIYARNLQNELNGHNLLKLTLRAFDKIKEDDTTEVNLNEKYHLPERTSSSSASNLDFLRDISNGYNPLSI